MLEPRTHFTIAAVSLALVLHARRPFRGEGVGLIAGFFAAWLATEWAWVIAGANAALAAVAFLSRDTEWAPSAAAGAFAAGVALTLVTEVDLDLPAWRDAGRTLGHSASAPLPPLWRVLLPFPPRRPGVRVRRDVTYAAAAGVPLALDIYSPAETGADRPILIQVHGGAWIIGDKREQGLPLLYHMAAHGWVCVNVNYRLCPRATFPEPLDDVSAAIAWTRRNARDFGGGRFVAVTGNSAGAHLAALAALDPPSADARVDAALLMYGVYDLVDRRRLMPPRFLHGLLRKRVLKVSIDDAPDRYRAASPLDRVHPNAPPMLVVHGSRDVLAPAQYAADFVAALRESGARAALVSLPGAQHAFDVFMSPRTRRAVGGAHAFLEGERHRWATSPGGRLEPAP